MSCCEGVVAVTKTHYIFTGFLECNCFVLLLICTKGLFFPRYKTLVDVCFKKQSYLGSLHFQVIYRVKCKYYNTEALNTAQQRGDCQNKTTTDRLNCKVRTFGRDGRTDGRTHICLV
uniref:Secreted protein n=1 Tax=Steinernema glaseri TaxID=37863 RepID=A0A1I8AD97_9BILA